MLARTVSRSSASPGKLRWQCESMNMCYSGCKQLAIGQQQGFQEQPRIERMERRTARIQQFLLEAHQRRRWDAGGELDDRVSLLREITHYTCQLGAGKIVAPLLQAMDDMHRGAALQTVGQRQGIQLVRLADGGQ